MSLNFLPRLLVIVCLAITITSGCAAQPQSAANPPPITPASNPQAPPRAAITAIRFEAGPCYGFCPIFSVTVHQDGAISYVGHRFTRLQGAHSLPPSPALFARLSEITTSPQWPWPRGNVLPGQSNCAPEATDLPSYRIAIESAQPRSLSYYSGCHSPEGARAQRLVQAIMQALAAHGVPTEGVQQDLRDERPPPERLSQ